MDRADTLLKKYAPFVGFTVASYSHTGEYVYTCGISEKMQRHSTTENVMETFSYGPRLDGKKQLLSSVDAGLRGVVAGCDDGTVCGFTAEGELVSTLVRAPSSVKKVLFSPDGDLVAVASKDDKVTVIDWVSKRKLSEASFDGLHEFIWSLDSQHLLITSDDGLTQAVAKELSEQSSSDSIEPGIMAFYPDSKILAVAQRKSIYLLDEDLTKKTSFNTPSKPTLMKFCPSGAYIALAFGTVVELWRVKDSMKVSFVKLEGQATSIHWHPSKNEMFITNDQGQLCTWPRPVPSKFPGPNDEILPFDEDLVTDKDFSVDAMDMADTQADSAFDLADTQVVEDPESEEDEPVFSRKRKSKEPEADLLADTQVFEEPVKSPRKQKRVSIDTPMDMDLDEDMFVEDDDGAGYVPDLSHRGIEPEHSMEEEEQGYAMEYDEVRAIQPGATEFLGTRRYLHASYLGYIWTLKQDENRYSVTSHFFDTGIHPGYHFTDHVGYNLGCMSRRATFYARTSPPSIFMRFHTGISENWSVDLDESDPIRCISVGKTKCVVCTESGLILTYSIFGVPLRVYRDAGEPTVAITAHTDNFFMIRQDSFTHKLNFVVESGEGHIYTRGKLSLPVGAHVKYVCFTQNGDPVVMDSDGVLLILSRWKEEGQYRWIPALDTVAMAKEHGREESYWPIGVDCDYNFHCVILKGAATQPPHPMPLTTDFPIKPMGEPRQLESALLKSSVFVELEEGRDEPENLGKLEIEVEKALLRLLLASCKNDFKLNRCLSIYRRLQDEECKDAAATIALRTKRTILAEKINEMREKEQDKKDE